MSEKISRRELIQKSLLGFGALSIPVAFTGCNDGSDDESPEIQADFLHGVAIAHLSSIIAHMPGW